MSAYLKRLPCAAALLQEVVASDPLMSKGRGRMLVFARDVAAANATAAALQGVGPPVLLFHRDRPQVQWGLGGWVSGWAGGQVGGWVAGKWVGWVLCGVAWAF
jgi:hypothetical protein